MVAATEDDEVPFPTSIIVISVQVMILLIRILTRKSLP